MSLYRLYFRDREGHFDGVLEIEAQDEAQAIRMANLMCVNEKRELWHDDSLLRQWDGARWTVPPD